MHRLFDLNNWHKHGILHQSLIGMKTKSCPLCNTSFFCSSSDTESACWCSQYPAIFSPEPGQDCFCPECLKKMFNDKMNHLITIKKTEELIKMASKHSGKEELIEAIDYYMENDLWVFTAWYHLKRGYCCDSGCRHCPYKTTIQ
jgi:hypothetical protein